MISYKDKKISNLIKILENKNKNIKTPFQKVSVNQALINLFIGHKMLILPNKLSS
jgi:hypothetical protein